MAKRSSQPYASQTARRVARVCTNERKTQKEIAEALGTLPGHLHSTIRTMLGLGELHTDAAPPEPGEVWHLTAGDSFWIDDPQRERLDEAARAARDPGLLQAQQTVLLLDGEMDQLRKALTPALTVGAVAWSARVVGEDARWLLAVDAAAGALVADQIEDAARTAGGRVRQFIATDILAGDELQRYLGALSVGDR